MLKHHPHSTSLSVAAVSDQPIESLTLYSKDSNDQGSTETETWYLSFFQAKPAPSSVAFKSFS